MPWATIGVLPTLGGVWPDEELIQVYRGRDVHLRPESETLVASVTIEYQSHVEQDQAFAVLRRFLSAATWGTRCGFEQVMALAGSQPGGCGRGYRIPPFRPPHRVRCHPLYAPEPRDPAALLALALFREAACGHNRIFKFLGLFKVLEIQGRGRTAIKALMTRHLPAARERANPLLCASAGHRRYDRDESLPRRLDGSQRCRTG